MYCFVSVTLLDIHRRRLIDLVGAYFQGGRIFRKSGVMTFSRLPC